MSNQQWETMDEKDFESMLENNLSEIPPEEIVSGVTPWKKAMNRILAGMALCSITLNALCLNYILPVIALSASPMAYITRLTKTSMLDALGQDYVRTAKAKGVARWKIIFKHTLRNAMIPVITYVGPMTAYILTGSLVVERIFTIGGLGAKFVDCIINRDYPMIMGTTIFLATLMITMNLITDIVYKMVDPRIKLD